MFVIILLAFTICCTSIISVSKNNIINNTVSNATTELAKLEDNLLLNKEYIYSAEEGLTAQSILKYFFFKQVEFSDANTEYVLTSENGTIYNNSGINPEYVLSVKEDSGIKHSVIHFEDKDYIVAGKKLRLDKRNCQIYLIRDISSVYEQIRRLIVICVGISMVVLAIAEASIILFLQKILGPLELLKKGADAIAGGDYKERISVLGNDEITAVASSFNKMAESVEQHISEVEETSEARNRLIHALSHEMRTPITAISGYSYALNHARMSDGQRREALEFIDLEATRLERLSGKLTDLVGLSSNKIVLSDINLSDIKKHIQMIFGEQKGIYFQIGEGIIKGDIDLLIMLITNLCDNARKAGATEIDVEINTEGIWVKDNGKGISKADQERIFEIYAFACFEASIASSAPSFVEISIFSSPISLNETSGIRIANTCPSLEPICTLIAPIPVTSTSTKPGFIFLSTVNVISKLSFAVTITLSF